MSASPPLTLDRFRELAAAYGARLERWPTSERARAEALLSSSSEARLVLEEEHGLDAELANVASFALRPDFERRLAELPVRNPQKSLSAFRRWLWAPLVGWGVAAALGLVLGASFADVDDTASDTTTTAAAEVSPDEALDALALGDFTDWEESAP